MIIPPTGGPFKGFKKDEGVTLAIRGLPERAIPVFKEEAAVYNWAIARRVEESIFPDEQEGVVFYVRAGTRGVITRLKEITTDSRSWVESAKIRLKDDSERTDWVPILMIFNPRLEKLIDEWRSRSGKK